MKTTLGLGLALLAATTFSAAGNEFAAAATDYYQSELMNWANDPVILAGLRASNEKTAGRSEEQTYELDQAWRGQVGTADASMIAPVLNNTTSMFLREKAEASGGAITEIILIDANGFNAGISHVTTDYYQGDEDQFNEVFPNGPGALWIGEVEFDESAQSYQVRVAMTIVDAASNEVLGTMTVSVDPETMM